MRKTIVALMCCFVLFGVWLQAADKSDDAQVKELEARLRAAETELKKAKELLDAITDAAEQYRKPGGRLADRQHQRQSSRWEIRQASL